MCYVFVWEEMISQLLYLWSSYMFGFLEIEAEYVWLKSYNW